ncbi:MAG TPA: cytochrome c [Pyrinomonadaceae bacterium]|nr:cytochrome c [Pyrinomonadaceae bacterium]
MIRFTFLLLLSLVSVAVLSCGEAIKPANAPVNPINSAPAQTPLPKATIDELASGRTLYASNCANCHKENGTGGEVEIEGRKMKPDDLTTARMKGFSDDKMIGVIVNGIKDEGMPAYKGKLSEGEMRDIVKFIRVELQKMPVPGPPKI